MNNLYNTKFTNSNSLEKLSYSELLNLVDDYDVKNELSRRLIVAEPLAKITAPIEIYEAVKFIEKKTREHFVLLVLDNQNQILHTEILHIGTGNASLVSVKDVFQTILIHGGIAFAVAHNHPSGMVTPSPEDISVTEKLKSSADMLDMTFIDHLIIGSEGRYTSLRSDLNSSYIWY